MAKYGIAIDIDKCTGCHSCFLACKDEFVGNDYLPVSAAQPPSGHTWIRLNEVERGTGTKVKVDYVPILCQHCDSLACAAVAPKGAVYRREDGIVIIDPEKAKGCQEIVNACPYGAVYWNAELNLPQKCTLCAHMLDAGEKTTRCAEACPTGALVFGDLEDPASPVSRVLAENAGKLELLKPEFDTSPKVKYIGLPKVFIAGEILLSDKPDECASGITVSLADKDGHVIRQTTTDFLGDFTFDGLEGNQRYVIKIDHGAYFPAEITVKTFASQNLGEWVLKAK
ncbi:MAG: 4Fe-4S dicluster domain-containing protein [Candidatus Accumulibacter sp.]|jgi:Fe-S-cluster-containing dehydrogenase component|nr:4Fe-4S dicluster domain-containing protein [Accumulibacter sp.]